jgi:hypothetical protein
MYHFTYIIVDGSAADARTLTTLSARGLRHVKGSGGFRVDSLRDASPDRDHGPLLRSAYGIDHPLALQHLAQQIRGVPIQVHPVAAITPGPPGIRMPGPVLNIPERGSLT